MTGFFHPLKRNNVKTLATNNKNAVATATAPAAVFYFVNTSVFYHYFVQWIVKPSGYGWQEWQNQNHTSDSLFRVLTF